MSDAQRISLAIEPELLERFDRWVAQRGEGRNRSEAIRDLMRDVLAQQPLDDQEERVGSLTLVYDHTQRNLAERLTSHGHDHDQTVLATLHIHLDHHMCLELMALKGKPHDLKHFADSLLAMKGVVHGALTLSAP